MKNEVLKTYDVDNYKILLIKGDITQEKVDVIVNAANSTLSHGGGVAGVISKKAGPEFQKESNEYVQKYGKVKTGDVAVTSAGNLPCDYVIHTVGPIWYGGNKDERDYLYLAVYNSLKKAEEMELNSISLPCISAGIFGYPFDKAVKVYKDAVIDYLKKKPNHLSEVRFVIYDNKNVDKFIDNFDI
ncbi:MAG: macro domain-containing protein [Thermotogota bacterium]